MWAESIFQMEITSLLSVSLIKLKANDLSKVKVCDLLNSNNLMKDTADVRKNVPDRISSQIVGW